MKRTDNAAAPAVEVPQDPGTCSWVSDRPCRFPGPMSHNTLGGPWWCAWHFRCSDPVEGARIVDASYRWDGTKESYLQARRDAVYGKPKEPEETQEAA